MLLALIAVLALTAGAGAATRGKAVVVRDPEDIAGKLDILRVSFADEGRLRASVSMEQDWDASDLRGADGDPPGSICLRLWTKRKAGETQPDYLVCVTAEREGDRLRGTVFRDRGNGLPKRVSDATVTRGSARSVTVKFAKSRVGRPSSLRFAAEAIAGSCAAQPSGCTDTAPNAPKTQRFTIG
jgi:hypothetical protein